MALCLLSCDIFHLSVYFNSSLFRFRAALNWPVDCFFVGNDHSFTYQKAGTHSIKCNIKGETPAVTGN